MGNKSVKEIFEKVFSEAEKELELDKLDDVTGGLALAADKSPTVIKSKKPSESREGRHLERLPLANSFVDGAAELSLEDLDGVAGGVMTKMQEKMLGWAVGDAKADGKTLNEVILSLPDLFEKYSSMYPNVTLDEVEDWIRANWDNL